MPTTERPFRHLCPEADSRDAMDDGEFWEHVFRTEGMPGSPEDDPDLEPPEDYGRPCFMCGAVGACSYDEQGRPLIHVDDDAEDEC